MTADLVQHAFHGQAVRVITDEHGDPWFVAADVARILGYRMASDMTRRLDDEDRGTRSVRTPSGDQDMTVITEPGLYVAVLGSQIPQAREFKRWVTTDVLPSIRRTGSYGAPALTGPLLVAAALIEANTMLEQKDAYIAALEPRAQVADELLDASGDVSVADAAKALTRAGIEVGSQRLFAVLADLGWIYRSGDARWHVKQSAIERGRMSALAQAHYHPRTGERVVDAPQPRVTPKGIAYLLGHLSKPRRLSVVPA